MAIHVNKVERNGMSDGAYAKAQSAVIGFACKDVKSKFVVFKAFIKSFDYNRTMDVEFDQDHNNPLGFKPKNEGGIKSDVIKVEFDVPSGDINEALANHYKYQVFIRMAHIAAEPADGKINVFLRNLIQNSAKPPRKGADLTWQVITQHGLRGSIKSLDYVPDLELGFYEYKGRFFAKAFTLSIEFDAGVAEGVDKKFGADGRTHTFSGDAAIYKRILGTKK